ncbi:unnamed protein product [Prorocentrum cordatum]|uniref:Uncharacterized protein n=1 Tax=Prorocentrum cordatum TaxID=2364126 RepID=A0ABN9TUG6_9DINO|nr:unnamed protein product [Polarella glacialis]
MPRQVERSVGAFLFRFTDSFYLTLPTWWTAFSDNAVMDCWDYWTRAGSRLVLDLLSAWSDVVLQMAGIVWMATYAQKKRTHLDVGVSFAIAMLGALLAVGQEFVDTFNYNYDSASWQHAFVLVKLPQITLQVALANVLFSGVGLQVQRVGGRIHSGHVLASSQRAGPTIEMPPRLEHNRMIIICTSSSYPS